MNVSILGKEKDRYYLPILQKNLMYLFSLENLILLKKNRLKIKIENLNSKYIFEVFIFYLINLHKYTVNKIIVKILFCSKNRLLKNLKIDFVKNNF